MAEIANMEYVVDEAEETYWADWVDRADETDVAEMALRMNALFYLTAWVRGIKKYSI